MTGRRHRASHDPPDRHGSADLAAATARHRRGTVAASAGHPQAAAKHFRAALRLLGADPPSPEAAALAGRLLISLASAEAEQGRVQTGLDLLDRADSLVGPQDRGIVFSQRALLQLRAGRYRAALPLFDEAVERLSRHPDPVALAKVLLNRGSLNMSDMRLSAARTDLARCARIAHEHGAELLEDKAVNGLGYCELLVGNIPAALEILARAEAGYRAHGPGNVPIAQVDRARALMAAGLAHEAVPALTAAVAAFQAQRLTQDRADAELTLAHALAAAGDPAGAAGQARLAERHFRARGNETGATLARLAAARAEFDQRFGAQDRAAAAAADAADVAVADSRGVKAHDSTTTAADTTAGRPAGARDAARLARRVGRLAEDLLRLGLVRDAGLARLLCARAQLRSGAAPESVSSLVRSAVPRGIGLPLETQLVAHLARAEVAVAKGKRGPALSELRKGLALLDAHRRTLGSLDLQTGVAALGRELTQAGLDLAVDNGTPHVVLAWSERSRAQALRIRPVRPAHAPDTAESIARLRHLDGLLRTDESEGRVDTEARTEVRREHAALRRKLREDSWTIAGSPSPREPSGVPTRELAARLGMRGHRMISLLRHRSTLLAVIITDGRVRLIGLGDHDHAAEAARRLVGDLDVRAARRLPPRLTAVIDASIRTQTDVLIAEILRPLIDDGSALPDDDSPLVLIPTGALSTVPWTLLRPLAERPLTVAPSALMWLAADRSGAGAASRGGGALGSGAPTRSPLLVAGPRLAHADREIAAIKRCYPDAAILSGSQATVEAVLRAMDGAHTVHLAAHGHHERGNMLFSRLDLADGPLIAHDLQRLAAPPRRVILSACEVGSADIRTGDEHLGFTTALLHTGTATVISSSARVPDETAPLLMTAMHEALAQGATPAVALSRAAAAHPYSTFVCHGSGTV